MRTLRTVAVVLAAGAAAALAGCATGGGLRGEPGAAAALQSGDRPFDMPYPLAAPPAENDIFHVPTGLRVDFAQMMDVLAGARVLFIGETHDSVHAHRVQLELIRELERRHPGQVAIGMEMFREPQQEVLDRWVRGELTEAQFLKLSKWYSTWSAEYGYYRAILDFARERGIDVVALNPSRELQQEVSRAGLDNLPAETAAKLPEIGPPDRWQRESLKAVFGAHLQTEGMLDSFLRVQSLWEESMASRAAEYLAGSRGAGKRLVVLAGGWHVRYGFGVPKRLFRRMPMPYAIVLPQELSVPEAKRDQLMDVDLPEIPLMPADFLWLVEYEDLEGGRPRMGVMIREQEGVVGIEKVIPGSPAERAGLAAGDEFVSIGGLEIESSGDVHVAVRARQVGDTLRVVVRREGAERGFDLTLEATPAPSGDHPKP